MLRIFKKSFFDAYPYANYPEKHLWIVSQKRKIRIIENKYLKSSKEKFPSRACLLYNLKREIKFYHFLPDDQERLIKVASTIAKKHLNKQPSKISYCFSAIANFFSGYSMQSTYSMYREILTYKAPIPSPKIPIPAPLKPKPKPPASLIPTRQVIKPLVIKKETTKVEPAPPAKVPVKTEVDWAEKNLSLESINCAFNQLDNQKLTSLFFTCFEKEQRPSDWFFLNLIRGINGCEIKENRHAVLTVRLMQILNKKKWLADYLKVMASYHTSFQDELVKAMIKFIQLYFVGALLHPDLKMSYFYLDCLAKSQVFYTTAVLKGVEGSIKPLKKSNISKSLKYKLHIWGKQFPQKWVQLLT